MYLRTMSSVPSVEPSLTITHFSGRKRLCDHRLKRQFDELGFIPCWGDKYVGWDLCHDFEAL